MKNIVIIGGETGVGLELLKSCLDKGYRVAISSKEKPFFDFKIKKDMFYSKSFDLRDIKLCKKFIEDVIKRWGTIHGIVFYAGITNISPLTECNEATYDDLFDVNLKSAFFLCQSVVKNMIKNNGGSIIFIGSSHMESGDMDRAAYAISKGGLQILSNNISKNYAKFKIRSNIVIMGWTPTKGELKLRESQGVTLDELDSIASNYIPMGRMLNEYDPIPALMYFLSDESLMVTGSIVRVNGGEYI
jgi:NAD(P)-dependent dehydrogenase (short-subunit alcohol dehydrogenase family)